MGLAGSKNQEVRAMTIAAFRLAQNNDQLSQVGMSFALLRFLVADSDSAINHWTNKGRLASTQPNTIVLTPEGLAECQNSLLGQAGAYSTTEDKVTEWVNRLRSGDGTARRSDQFGPSHWSA